MCYKFQAISKLFEELLVVMFLLGSFCNMSSITSQEVP